MKDNAEVKKLLENSRLFGAFSSEVINTALPLLAPATFQKEQVICLKEDPSDCLYIVGEGEVEISVSSGEGKIIVLDILSKGDVFGEIGLLDKKARTANVVAKTNVKLYSLSSADFVKLTKMFGTGEWLALLSYVCFRFRHATNNLEETAFLDADIRIARKILELYEKIESTKDNTFTVSISQENLGRMAALSREATNKALSRLEETGLIERKYKNIIVPDMKAFMHYVRA